jgi:uncharacterized protein YuzB (UPF0349 family)
MKTVKCIRNIRHQGGKYIKRSFTKDKEYDIIEFDETSFIIKDDKGINQEIEIDSKDFESRS